MRFFSSVIDLVLNCGCFVYIGAWMPFSDFNTPELGITSWRLVILFLIILVIRRIPALLILYYWIPEISGWKEALFSGYFGMSAAVPEILVIVYNLLNRSCMFFVQSNVRLFAYALYRWVLGRFLCLH
jgi:NhaP-type Na+/H+ or K+/H+ antiporter